MIIKNGELRKIVYGKWRPDKYLRLSKRFDKHVSKFISDLMNDVRDDVYSEKEIRDLMKFIFQELRVACAIANNKPVISYWRREIDAPALVERTIYPSLGVPDYTGEDSYAMLSFEAQAVFTPNNNNPNIRTDEEIDPHLHEEVEEENYRGERNEHLHDLGSTSTVDELRSVARGHSFLSYGSSTGEEEDDEEEFDIDAYRRYFEG